MPRHCVISVAALSRRMLDLAPADGALRRLAGAFSRPIAPVCPAVTCTMQATVTTGAAPGRHGIIANGLYFPELGKISFWEQSNRLLDVERFWKREKGRVAMLFWQNSMFGAADVVLTPRPVHTPDGRTVSSCYSQPADLYDRLAGELGPFELKHYWGPLASIESSRWIAAAAERVWRDQAADLQLVYLPHLDYALQKVGPADASIAAEVAAVDALVGRLSAVVAADGSRLIVMGDYGIVPVGRAALPNVALRRAGLLPVRRVGGAETVEVGEAAAVAMVDHQVAHVYCADDAARRQARAAIEGLDGVAAVLDLAEGDPLALRHRRSGQLVALADPDAWFAYYWWEDASAAPPFARTVDIHRKPGYDPCELFFDPQTRSIPLTPELVRGSHGLIPTDAADFPVLLADAALPDAPAGAIEATAVADLLAAARANR